MKICKPSYFRRKLCSRWRTIYCVICYIFFLAVLVCIDMVMKSRLHLVDDAVIQLDKCPACFGVWENVCFAFASGDLKVRGNYFWQSEYVKGVWYGVWNDVPVVVKTLGHRKELELLDEKICQNVTKSGNKHCNVQEKVWRSFLNPPSSFKSSVMQFMECPGNKFATLLEKHLRNNMNVVQLHQKVMTLTNLHFNQEFIFLQIFSERFPEFLPKVYGSCGRAVVVEYVGRTLSSAIRRPWRERVKLSLKLIQMARTFTRTQDNLALYMCDVIMDNFAVDEQGNVKLIDCEHIIIVDMRLFNTSYVIKSEEFCSARHKECLTFVPENLCKGESQDHNYYAVCRNLLAGIGASQGLLHSAPDKLVNKTLLEYLQYNCVYSKQISREQAIDQLEKELQRHIT